MMLRKTMLPLYFLLPWTLVRTGSAANFSSVSDKYSQLKEIPPPSRWPGGQDFGKRCCRLAVNASLHVVDGEVETLGTFVTDASLLDKQFPCEAKFNGDKSGTTEVHVPYGWCREKCPGWQISHTKNLHQWVGPLVGFILPTIIFCLTIPRQQKLAVPDEYFKFDVSNIFHAPIVMVYALRSGVLAFVDLLVWVSVVFTLSGPMLLSGLYEAQLDIRLVLFVKSNRDLAPHIRAHVLYAVLAGNLDPPSRLAHLKSLAKPGKDAQSSGLDDQSQSLAWGDVYRLAAELKDPPVPEESSGSDTFHASSVGRNRSSSVDVDSDTGTTRSRISPSGFVDDRDRETIPEQQLSVPGPKQQLSEPDAKTRAVKLTQSRLRTLLEAQFSFGTTVGAPVLFYAGAFVYTMADLRNQLGDNDASHALAFGMWWMTVPIVTIVAGCLLAGNNPNTLAALVGHFEDTKKPQSDLKWLARILDPVYQSAYRPARMWDRGRNKMQWCIALATLYRHEVDSREVSSETVRTRLSRAVKIRKHDWFHLVIGTMFLIGVPTAMAFITSYFTPAIGLGCRSMVFMLHGALEFTLVMLWVFNWRYSDGKRGRESLASGLRYVWVFLGILCYAGKAFLAVGGTFLQILGVFRNCRCKIPISHWWDHNALVLVSSNSRVQIERAETTWLPAGAAATSFLCVISFVGWWYQRHLRFQFIQLINDLDPKRENKSNPKTAGSVSSPTKKWRRTIGLMILGESNNDVELSSLEEDTEILIPGEAV